MLAEAQGPAVAVVLALVLVVDVAFFADVLDVLTLVDVVAVFNEETEDDLEADVEEVGTNDVDANVNKETEDD